MPRATNAWRVAVVCGMASYIDAAAIVGFSSSVVILQHAGTLTLAHVGFASGCLTLGIAAGAMFGGRLGDRIGRRPVFLVTMVLIAVAALVLVLGGSPGLTITSAVLLGLGVGADLPVSLATISESAGERERGRMLIFSNILWLAGMAVSFLIGALVGDRGIEAVHILFGHVAATAVVVGAMRIAIPESSLWQLARSERRAAVRTVRAERIQVRALLTRPYAQPFAGLVIFYALTNLIANTHGQFGAFVLVNHAGASLAEASRLLLLSLPLSLAGFLWFMKVADGRRLFAYFRVGAVCGCSAPLLLAVAGVTIPTYAAALVLLAAGNVFAFEAVMKIWTQRSFPTLLRSTAQGAILAAARLAAAIFAILTPLLLQIDTAAFYGILTLAGAVGWGYAWLTFRNRALASEFLSEGRHEASAGDR